MPDIERAQKLLALFTSADCAEGMTGDLAEAPEAGSAFWFWRQVLAAVAELWGRTVTGAPLRTLGLAAGGCWLFASSALGSIAAVGLFPQYIGSASSWLVIASLWWGGALGTGASLVSIGQARGMAACVLIAIAAEAVLMPLGVTVLATEILGASRAIFSTIAALAPMFLLAGATLNRLRTLARSTNTVEAES